MTVHEKLIEIEASLSKALKVVRELKVDAPAKEVHVELVTPEEYTALMWELDGWPDITKAIHRNYEVTSIDKLPRAALSIVRQRIKEIKKTHENYVNE